MRDILEISALAVLGTLAGIGIAVIILASIGAEPTGLDGAVITVNEQLYVIQASFGGEYRIEPIQADTLE